MSAFVVLNATGTRVAAGLAGPGRYLVTVGEQEGDEGPADDAACAVTKVCMFSAARHGR